MQRLTKEQAIILTIYTRVVLTDFQEVLDYCTKLVGSPVTAEMMADHEYAALMKDLVTPEFNKLIPEHLL